jgi:hypothetical protein
MQTNTNNNEEDLLKKLEAETEHKSPGGKSSFWEEEVSGEEKQETAKVEEKKETPKPEEKPAEEQTPKVTEKAKRASARTAVGMIDMTQKAIFSPLIEWKYMRKFKKKELDRLEEKDLIDTEKSLIVEASDMSLRTKWDRLMKKRDKKIDAIPFSAGEKEDLEEAFFTYFDFKEKTLPPEWFMYLAVINTVGRRLVDVVTD